MPGVATPDVQFAFAPASYVEGQLGVLDKFPGMTCGIWQHRPASRGPSTWRRPTLRSNRQRPNYLSDRIDQETIVGGLRKARELFAQPTLAKFVDVETVPGPDVQTDDELLDFARRTGSTVFHPIGTCKMGTDPMAVVDPELRMHGSSDHAWSMHPSCCDAVGEYQRRCIDDCGEGGRYDQGRELDRPFFGQLLQVGRIYAKLIAENFLVVLAFTRSGVAYFRGRL